MDMPHSALTTNHWRTIWSYVPTDFSVPVVSVSWEKDWAALWDTLSSLNLDFRSSNYATAVRIVAAARPPLPPARRARRRVLRPVRSLACLLAPVSLAH